MHPLHENLATFTRRALLQRLGLGGVALASLFGPSARGDMTRTPHFRARAKSVIYLHMVGAPSQLDLFDHKPELTRHDGRPCPRDFIDGQRFAFIRGHPKLLGTRFRFARHARTGAEISELMPHLASVADELAIVRTVHTDEFNHAPAQLFLHTGFGGLGRPSLGAWVTYGLGAETQNLPAYVVLLTGAMAGAGSSLWANGFLPSIHQGVQFQSSGDPVLFLSNPAGHDRNDRRRVLDAIQELNKAQLADVGDPEIATRISQYETAYRMQTAVPQLMDISRESAQTLAMYGAQPGKASFGSNCLLARRLVERGVRIVQLFDDGWDHHANLFTALPRKCKDVDRPIAALIFDLKQRGLLDETLVIWGGEFGRTPMLQTDSGDGKKTQVGRDHHKSAFTMWLAGGGVKRGMTLGRTDDLGYTIVENPVHVHDLNATVLHLLGMDHEQLTFRYQGRDFRLTDVHGRVESALLA